MSEIEQRLAQHDWWHMMSDSHAVWERGNTDRKQIEEMLDKLPKKEADRLWCKYAPKQFWHGRGL